MIESVGREMFYLGGSIMMKKAQSLASSNNPTIPTRFLMTVALLKTGVFFVSRNEERKTTEM